MFLPKLVRRFKFVVGRKKTTDYPLPTTHPRQRRAGFTLIELLITITIIAILLGIGTLSWTMSQKKGRDGKRKSDLKTIQQALEDYYRTNLAYPGWDAWPNNNWCWVINSTNNPQVKDALVTTGGYLQQLPKDPSAGSQSDVRTDYVYDKRDRNHYDLYAKLENTNDPEVSQTPFTFACSGTFSGYNYKVTSP